MRQKIFELVKNDDVKREQLIKEFEADRMATQQVINKKIDKYESFLVKEYESVDWV